MQVAVLGMGNMGRSIALRVLEGGHDVRVWNRTPGKAGEVVDAGAVEVDGPEAAVEDAEAAVLSLTDDRAVRQVAVDSDLARRLGDGVLVDMSTVSPATSRQEAAAARRMVAAPVLGAPTAVRAGHAVYLLAGRRAVVDDLAPLWSALGDQRWWSEDPGVATTLKLLSNYLLMGGLALLAEAVAAGQRVGLERAVLHDFFEGSALVPAGVKNRLDDLLDGAHDGWFAARLGAKDVRLARELAASAGLELPLADLVEQRYEALERLDLGGADIAAIVELFRRPAA
ncbi:MAG: NAD(P)-dependent oxidoreductase [Acidimicrobiales bacterium]